ncbi:MAG: GAF domain-containing protein [Armatimonadetes bacterium]|nr:GAF domain-containing protein [Armatimonadota bacterium]
MIPADVFASLAQTAAQAKTQTIALELLVNAAMKLTDSRNALLAVVDEDEGWVELRHGCGSDWSDNLNALRFQPSETNSLGIVGAVAMLGESVRLGDVDKDPRYRELFSNSQSEVAVPVKDRHGRIVAVLNVESDRKNHYTALHQKMAEGVAHLASVIFDREERERREQALMQIGNALDRADTEESLISQILDVAEEVLNFHSFTVFLLDRDRDEYILKGATGSLRAKVGEASYRAGEGLTGWVCQTGESLLLNKPQSDPRWVGKFTEIPSDQVASYLAVPIMLRGIPIGALRLLRGKNDNPLVDMRFTDDDLRLLESISDQTAAGLDRIGSIRRTIKVERMAAWGEMSAKSSHMIGNRMFALKGEVNELGFLLKESSPDLHSIAEIHRNLEIQVLRIDELLQEFRDYVSASQVSLVRADLNFVVKESVTEVFPKRSEVELQMELSEDIPEVELDVRKFRRSVSELVENALSYISSGNLTVRTRLATKDDIQISRMVPHVQYAVIEVEDTGPGVPESQKDVIFQPFFSSRVKGMGLGLSIVKGIAEAHGGTVVERGVEGKGAKFVMLVPVANRP